MCFHWGIQLVRCEGCDIHLPEFWLHIRIRTHKKFHLFNIPYYACKKECEDAIIQKQSQKET